MAIREKVIPYKVQIRGTTAEKKNIAGLQHEFDRAKLALAKLNRAERKSGRVTRESSAQRARLTTQLQAQRNALNDARRAQLGHNNALRQNSGFVSGITQGFKGFAKSMIGPTAIIGGAVAIIAGIGKVVGAAAKTIKEFEQKAANLGAIANLSGSELAAMKTQAKQLGATTSFTAGQVLELQTELAKLGFGQTEILDMTKSVLGLSAALGAELGETSAFVGANLRAFGKDATDAQEFVDVFAAAASNSSLDLNKMSTALAAVGPIAANSGQDIQSTTAFLGLLTDRGLDASTAGTGLRNVFLELSNKGLTMQEALQKIATSSDKTKTSFELFGKRGAVIGTILADTALETEGTTSAFQRLEKKLNESGGTAERMARTQLNTLEGKGKLLSSAWDGFILSLDSGDGALSRAGKNVTDLATSFITAITPAEDITHALRVEMATLERLGPALADSVAGSEERTASIVDLREQYPQLLDFIEEHHEGIGLETASTEELNAIVKEYSGTLEKKIDLMLHEAEITASQARQQEAVNEALNIQAAIDERNAAAAPEDLDNRGRKLLAVQAEIDALESLNFAAKNSGIIQLAYSNSPFGDEYVLETEHLERLTALKKEQVKLEAEFQEEKESSINAVNGLTDAEAEQAEIEKAIYAERAKQTAEIEQATLKALSDAEDAAKEKEKADKKAATERAKRRAKERATEKALRDSRIAIIDDERERERQKAEASTADKIAALKKAGTLTDETETNLKTALKKKLAAIDEKFEKQGTDLQKKESKERIKSFTGTLVELKAMYADGLILQADYEKKKAELFKASSKAEILNFDGDLAALQSLLDNKLISLTQFEAKKKELADIALAEEAARVAQREQFQQSLLNIAQGANNVLRVLADNRIKEIEGETAKRQEAGTSNEQFEKEQQAKIYEINKKAFERNKVLALAEVAINLAKEISAINAAAAALGPAGLVYGPIQIGLAILSAGVQAGAITAATFETGGRPIDASKGGLANGPSHDNGGIKFLTKATGGQQMEMEGGEFIVNQKDTKNNLGLLKFINSGGVTNSPFAPLRMFADGGQPVASQYIRPTLATATVTSQNGQSSELAAMIGEQIADNMKDFATKFKVVNVAQETDAVLVDAHEVDNRGDLG